jgi:hypothetical protein
MIRDLTEERGPAKIPDASKSGSSSLGVAPGAYGMPNSRPVRGRSGNQMATIRAYKLVSAGTSTASAAATITLPRNGVITAVSWECYGVGAANVTSGLRNELSLSSVTTIAQNDTPGNSISSFSAASNVASAAFTAQSAQSNLGVPVVAGDKLYIHQQAISSSPSTCTTSCTVFVMH